MDKIFAYPQYMCVCGYNVNTARCIVLSYAFHCIVYTEQFIYICSLYSLYIYIYTYILYILYIYIQILMVKTSNWVPT